MPREFRLPDLGEGVKEGEIVRVLVAEGDLVREDQPLMEVETDKAAVEIPSPFSGVVVRVHVTPKQVVNVGDVMVTFGEDGSGSGPAAAPPRAASTAPAAAAPPAAARGGGRITPASPAVRKLARTLGVDLETVAGSGPGGRVQREDVERAAAAGRAPAASVPATQPRAPSRASAPAPGAAGRDSWGPVRREALSRARRTIAETMARSVATIPHVTDTDDADVTDLDRLRRGYASPGGTGPRLTLLAFAVRASALALAKFPLFNASYDTATGEVVYHDYVSISIGVHTERGLIAPVIRDAGGLSVTQIAEDLARLAGKARAASFEVNDTRGGTFTISNAGAMGGSRYSTPIINEPQSAILALGRTRWQPWVVEGRVVPRYILPLSLSFDHRLIDGAHEVAFMQELIGQLENPARLLL